MTTQNTEANHRAAARLPAGTNVWVHCRRAGTEADLANGLLDLSAGGVQVLSKEPLEPGELVEVLLGGAGVRGTIRRTGEVRWAVEVGGGACCAGVRFLAPLEDAEVQTLALPPSEADSSWHLG
jgi:hypothetical protein